MADRKLVSAITMSVAVERDPQFHLPLYPKLLEGLVTLPIDGGLLIEGAAEQQVFRGRASLTLLPQLLPLLDGSRTLADAARLLRGIPPEAVRNAVSLLYTRGVLEEGAEIADLDASRVPAEAVDFLTRHVDETRLNRNGKEAANRLQLSTPLIIGDQRLATMLIQELARMGITGANVGDLEQICQGPTLVIALATDDRPCWADLDNQCGERRIPWLRSVCNATRLEIGPLFERDETACYDCFISGRDESIPPEPASILQEIQWISLLAVEIVYLISRISQTNAIFYARCFEFSNWTQTTLSPIRRPGCMHCCPLPGWETHPAEYAYAFEQSVALPSKHRSNPKHHQVHYKPKNLELQGGHKEYPSGMLIPLLAREASPAPAGTYLETKSPSPNGRLTLDSLAGLLLRTGGLRMDATSGRKQIQRWAPTGGNLGSVQMYILANNVEGLRPGVYYYDPFKHGLVALPVQPDLGDVELLAEQITGNRVGGFDALVILSGALERVASKYGSFAYRIIYLDAGVAGAQIQAFASGYGLAAKLLHQWNDEIAARSLGLANEREPITSVVSLTGRLASPDGSCTEERT